MRKGKKRGMRVPFGTYGTERRDIAASVTVKGHLWSFACETTPLRSPAFTISFAPIRFSLCCTNVNSGLWLLFLIVGRRFLGIIDWYIRFLPNNGRENFLVDFLRLPCLYNHWWEIFTVLSAIQPRLLIRYSIGRNRFFLRFRQLNLIIAVKNLFQFDFQRFPVTFSFSKGLIFRAFSVSIGRK